MLHPYLLATLASLDTSGRLIVLGTAMQFLGVAIDPALAALVLTEESYENVLWLGIAMTLALILGSRFDHCLNDLLYRYRAVSETRCSL